MKKNEIISYVTAKLAEAQHLAKEKTQEDGESLHKRRAFSRIKKYLDDFLAGKEENRIIVLPGLRGVGKTTLQLQLYRFLTLEKDIDQDRVLYFSADETREYIGATITEVVNTYVEDMLKTSLINLKKEIFIFIDEAHFDRNWSTAAKIIYDKSKKIFLVLTGSSALSMEMSIDLARRAKKETVFPLNFSEYLILKHGHYPVKGTAESLRGIIFNPSRSSLEKARENWRELKRKSLNLGRPLEREFEQFIYSGGFPFGIKQDEKDTYEKIFGMIDRIIEKDIFTLQSFNTDTRNTIARIIYYLALQHPGETSDAKLSQKLGGTSSKLVRSILDVLEKAHLVFSVKPYGGAGRIIKKAWKYYFLSPSLNTAIRFKLGRYEPASKANLGLLAEGLVASTFLRMKETLSTPTNIFYDGAEGGVDFIITTGAEGIIPVEVSIGKKDAKQIKKAISRYNAKYGIIISDDPEIRIEDNIVYLPIISFSFV